MFCDHEGENEKAWLLIPHEEIEADYFIDCCIEEGKQQMIDYENQKGDEE